MFRFSGMTFLGVSLLSTTLHAQAPLPPPMTETDRTRLLIDMVGRLKNAIEKIPNSTPETYKTVGIRLLTCAIIGRSENSNASEVYAKAASVLYPNIVADREASKRAVTQDFARNKSDKKAAFYFVRNCRDLGDTDESTVDSAVLELTLQPR